MIPVMLLINCASLILLKTNGYVGLNSIRFVFQYLINYPYSEDKNGFRNTRIIFSSFQFQRNLPGALNFSILMEILHSYLKEFSPKPSTGMFSVFLCCNVSRQFVQLKTALLNSNWHHSQLSKGFGLTLSCFVLKLTNVYDNTNELFFCTEMCIPNTTKAVFCILIIFKVHFSHILLILVTVRCTYWGPLWWRDSVILTVGKKTILFIFFWICCCHSDDQKDTCDVHLSLCPAPVV